ncbi:CpsD/CapB family tyrosine-protein kinase [Haloimpatiens sp. FM7330]|uniref:CpsD/CapB family tyrosine-protein kinase n=1 Tax=Haloimpatiens sp. FM7330 TaxID=3298610 RepID=UPI003630CF1D
MLIVEKKPKSMISENYRTLRTNIRYSSFDKKMQTILITSTVPSEGKSTTACNLAMSMSEIYEKVLIIDCDLRKPTIHKKFNISNTYGLSNYLQEEADFDSMINHYSKNLYVLSSGRNVPNPSEMLSSKRFKEFLNRVRNEFDVIVIDSPPVLSVSDAQVLGSMVDGVIFVIGSCQTEAELCKKAKVMLEKVNANIIGAVLTKTKVKSKKNYGYQYYYNSALAGEK